MTSNDYEIIDLEGVSEHKSQHIKDFDSSIGSSVNAKSEKLEESQKLQSPGLMAGFEDKEKVEKSEKFEQSSDLEQSYNVEFSEEGKKSETMSKSEKSSPFGKKFDKAFLSKEDEILTGKIEEFINAEKGDLPEDRELFQKIFKQHYFVAVLGMFSLYHIAINLVEYLKNKACA